MGTYYIPMHRQPALLFPPPAVLAEMFGLARSARRRTDADVRADIGQPDTDWLEALRPLDAHACAGMKNLLISICSSRDSRLHAEVPRLCADLRACGHSVRWVQEAEELEGGDICLFLGYDGGLDARLAGLHAHNLQVSEDLPAADVVHDLSWNSLAMEGDEVARLAVRLLAADSSMEGGLRQLKECFLGVFTRDTVRRLCLDFVRRYPDSVVQDFLP